MNELTTIVTSSALDVLILGWIDAKARRSNSMKTRLAYQDTITQFRVGLKQIGLDLDYQDDQALAQIALTAQVFAGFSARGKEVRPATYNQRLAILSSFYEYGIKQAMLSVNPIARVDRAKVQAYQSAQPLTSETTTAALAAIDRNTLAGKRDYALLALLLSTGRRLAEVEALEVRNLMLQAGKITATFERCKGGKTMLDSLPYPVSHAILDWLQAYYGDDMVPGKEGDDRPVWVSLANSGRVKGKRLGEQSIADVCQKHLGTSKVHTTRHTWAHAMEEAGASAATIQARLGHESLATTGRYLAQLKRADNPYADRLAANLGIQ